MPELLLVAGPPELEPWLKALVVVFVVALVAVLLILVGRHGGRPLRAFPTEALGRQHRIRGIVEDLAALFRSQESWLKEQAVRLEPSEIRQCRDERCRKRLEEFMESGMRKIAGAMDATGSK